MVSGVWTGSSAAVAHGGSADGTLGFFCSLLVLEGLRRSLYLVGWSGQAAGAGTVIRVQNHTLGFRSAGGNQPGRGTRTPETPILNNTQNHVNEVRRTRDTTH